MASPQATYTALITSSN